MAHTHFDIDNLRTFVAGIELGSYARAAETLGRSTSAVSAQLKKLEEQAGLPLLRKAGRNVVPTDAGETLLAYARRLLALNDEAVSALRGAQVDGVVKIGLQEDFGEQLLPEVLGRFARAHPAVRIEAQVARNATLLQQVQTGQLDLALAWEGVGTSSWSEHLSQWPMQWIGARAQPLLLQPGEPLPLVVFDAPCLMRSAATAALDAAGIAWRIAFTSHSLSGVWAAVAAGLGVTVRTPAGLPSSLRALDSNTVSAALPPLPALPQLGLALHRHHANPAPAVQRLRDIVTQTLLPQASIAARSQPPVY
ncbi:LysR substrate-binding domain-containing protein [Amantichitinum ursilacus]|uniref:HTH-type transcriptional regulator YofA n=1 Tax=Amantichitinum ursilacus TaxID=857265 RepID=A0A0N1JTB5_9NEIS|nr:LysR substrate-binding domain-containing protein [Amantichitinum ursilacus]KPC53889.1 HTH-type transcriptional regulator YofA [Amantichitinum ursilacus]